MTTTTGRVRLTIDGPVATIWLDNPDKRNAMNHEMWVGLGEHCAAVAADPSLRVLVVRGVGDHFCAGADISGFSNADPSYGRANAGIESALAGCPKPTIAFIRGSCIGGGVQIASFCDLRIADTTSRYGITPARLGIVYPAFAVQRIVTLIGPSAAKHLLFSAELIDAERALRVGLVDELHAPAAADARLEALVTVLATERSALTQQAAKAMIEDICRLGHVDDATAQAWSDELSSSPDRQEGIAAFLERRPPNFTWSTPGRPRRTGG